MVATILSMLEADFISELLPFFLFDEAVNSVSLHVVVDGEALFRLSF